MLATSVSSPSGGPIMAALAAYPAVYVTGRERDRGTEE
jgi:hypothetical protein